MKNPSLREIPRNQPASVIPPQRDASILDWLQGTGRLMERDNVDFDYQDAEEEINEFLAGDDNSFDIDDDDDDALDLDD